MTHWIVTGSRAPRRAPYTLAEHRDIDRVLDAFFRNGDTVITGGCIDVDSFAMQRAHERGLCVVTLLPASREFTNTAAVSLYSDFVIETGVGYWQRDKLEVERADKALAFPLLEKRLSSPRSGTWHTWQLAVEANKHCALVVMRPEHGPILIGPEWPTASDALGAQLPLL